MNRRKGRRPNKRAFSLEASLGELEDTDAGVLAARRQQLCEALCAYPDAVLRDDSRLAFQFIAEQEGGGAMAASAVAAEMATVQLLYSKTEYNALMQRDLRAIADWAKATHPAVPWSEVWTIVRETMVPACKLQATKPLMTPS